jgi:nucleotide-binding universal stress UspA family protein
MVVRISGAKMFTRVLFPTDFSEHAKRALDCVAGLPKVEEVILLHVIDTGKSGRERWIEGAIEKTVMRSLNEEKHLLENAGLKVKPMVKPQKGGSIGPSIVDVAADEQASVIVMSARGKNLIKGILLGSVSSFVLRHATIPLLIMRYKVIERLSGEVYEKFCPMALSKVLCPTDFSTFSDQAIKTVAGIPGIGSIVLVHVISKGETEDEIGVNEALAHKNLEEWKEFLGKKGISATSIVRTGNPTAEINRVAEEEDVSLICMSSYGKGWFEDLLVGSTCAEVTKNTTRPILVLR